MDLQVEALDKLMTKRTILVLQISEHNAEIFKMTQNISGIEVSQLHLQNLIEQQGLAEIQNLKKIEKELSEIRKKLSHTEAQIKSKQDEIAEIDEKIIKINSH
ncbi:MAG: hypothetical protein ABJN57_14820 [Hyphomicrobiales bacterium]